MAGAWAALTVSACSAGEPGAPRLSASHVCGEVVRPASVGFARQTAVLTTRITSQFPDRDIHALWLCNFADLCDPVVSFDQARGLRAHWLDADTLEVVTNADAPYLWPAPPAPRNAPWPRVRFKAVRTDRPDSPPLEQHLSAGLGPVLGQDGVACRRIRDFRR